jgi:signal transduction histidine kinase
MDILTYILLAIALLVVLLLLRAYRRKKNAVRLLDELQAFLADPDKPLSLNLAEGDFALVENAVKEVTVRWLDARRLRAEEAERTNEALMWLSHQLRTPLSSLRLFCEMSPGPYAAEQLQLIDRMEHLLAELLRLEKFKAGGYAMHFEICRVEEPLLAAWESLRHAWPDVALAVDGSAVFRMDRGWMEEAFSNLLKNACQHMPDAEGAIHAHIRQGEAAVQVVISDTAGGVPEDELPRLFTRFFVSTAAGKGGAGIGMSIVREVVLRHHGTLSARNGVRGLEVDMVFPRIPGNLAIS